MQKKGKIDWKWKSRFALSLCRVAGQESWNEVVFPTEKWSPKRITLELLLQTIEKLFQWIKNSWYNSPKCPKLENVMWKEIRLVSKFVKLEVSIIMLSRTWKKIQCLSKSVEKTRQLSQARGCHVSLCHITAKCHGKWNFFSSNCPFHGIVISQGNGCQKFVKSQFDTIQMLERNYRMIVSWVGRNNFSTNMYMKN